MSLIKLEDAKRAINKQVTAPAWIKTLFNAALNEVEEAQIQIVNYGYWVQKYDDQEGWKIVCSHCGNDYFSGMYCDAENIMDEMKYCPNCGRKNDSVEVWRGFEVEE